MLALIFVIGAAIALWIGPTTVPFDEPSVMVTWTDLPWNYTTAFVTVEAHLDTLYQSDVSELRATGLSAVNPVRSSNFTTNGTVGTVYVDFECHVSADYLTTISVWGLTLGSNPVAVFTYGFWKACLDPLCPTCEAAGICGEYGLCVCPPNTTWQLPSCDFQDTMPLTICPTDFITGTFRFLPPEEGGNEHHGLDWIGLYPGDGSVRPDTSPYINTFGYVVCNSPIPCERTSAIGSDDYSLSLGLLLPPHTTIRWVHFYSDSYSIITQGLVDYLPWDQCGVEGNVCDQCVTDHTEGPCNSTLGCPCRNGFYGAYCERGCDGFYEVAMPGVLHLDQSELSNGTDIGHANNAHCGFYLAATDWQYMTIELEFLGLGNGDAISVYQMNNTVDDFEAFNDAGANASSVELSTSTNTTLRASAGAYVYVVFQSNSYGVGRGLKAVITTTPIPPNLYLTVMLPVLLLALLISIIITLVVMHVLGERKKERPPNFNELVITEARQVRLEDSRLAFSMVNYDKVDKRIRTFAKFVRGKRGPSAVVQLFYDTTDHYVVEDFVDALFSKKPDTIPAFLLLVLNEEITTGRTNPDGDHIFARDTPFTLGYTRYLHLVGMPFLWQHFHRLINDMASDKVSSGAIDDVTGDIPRLKIFVRQLLLLLPDLVSEIPAPIVHVTQLALNLMGTTRASVAALIVGRFLCLALAHPDEWGIVHSVPTPKLHRNLMIVTKVLQATATGTPFKEDNYLAAMNEEVTSHQTQMDHFFTALQERGCSTTDYVYDVQITTPVRTALLVDLMVQAGAIDWSSSVSTRHDSDSQAQSPSTVRKFSRSRSTKRMTQQSE